MHRRKSISHVSATTSELYNIADKEDDFAMTHPGGVLGRKLLFTVNDLMHSGEEIPSVANASGVLEVIQEMSRKRLGVTLVVNAKGNLSGIVTDGDLRRMIERQQDISQITASDLMGKNPKTIQKDKLAAEAVRPMEENAITSLVVSEDGKTVEGILHLHDLLKAGVI